MYTNPVDAALQMSVEIQTKTGVREDDNDNNKRWTKFSWEPPPPPDQFMKRFWNTLVYVSNVLTADNIRVFLYGRRYLRRRYRLIYSNTWRTHRDRRVLRATASITRTLRGCWAAACSPLKETRNEASRSIQGHRPVASAWQHTADSTAEYTQCRASPPANVLTSLHLLELSNQFVSDAHSVDLCPSGTSAVSLHWASDGMTKTTPPGFRTWSCPSGFSMVLLREAFAETVMKAALDATILWLSLTPSLAGWSSPCHNFFLPDLGQRPGSVVRAGDWSGVLQTGSAWLFMVIWPTTERVDIMWMRVADTVLYCQVNVSLALSQFFCADLNTTAFLH